MRFACCLLSLCFLLPSVAVAQQSQTGPPPSAVKTTTTAVSTISGSVADRTTGLPLSGARVGIVGSQLTTVSDGNGAFAFTLPPGVYVFEVRLRGYQTTQTDEVATIAGSKTSITLALNRVEAQSGNYRQVARTSTRASDVLQPAAVIQHTISASDQLAQGTFRVDRAIEELPNVVFSTGISTPGIDGYISLRGLPGVTTTLIDGHPTSVSLNSVALFPFQSVNVIYGSGKGQLYPINAIGGVIDLRTLQPTRVPSATFLQSFGTFDHLTTDLQSTGTLDRLGYAFSLGTEGLDAPYARTTRYEPLSGWDPTATDPSVRARSFYTFDSPYAVRSEFLKLQYAASSAFHITATVLGSTELHDNDGDKSIDLHTYDRVLADGNRNLANKSTTDPCPANEFTATNFAGVANGTGPNGQPDGGFPCQTPQQYATLRAGYTTGELGSITTNNADNDIKFEIAGSRNYALVDIYASLFRRDQDFHNSSYITVPGDLNGLHTKRTDDSNAGITISDDVLFDNDDFGVGFYSNNYRQDEHGNQFDPVSGSTNGSYIFNYGNAIRTYFLRETHHSASSPFTIYLNDYIKDSEQPHAFFNDPRLAILYRKGNNTLRVAAGEGSNLPYAPDNQTYQPVSLAQFTSGVNCNGQNTVGTAPTGFTKPERASDEEFSYAHRWSGDSATQIELYNQNFASKVQYGYNAPLSYTGTAFISPSLLASYLSAISTKCNGNANLNLLTLQGNYNLGRQLARGIDITGRQRVSPSVFFDYSYGTQSVSYRSLPLSVLQGDHRVIIGAQTFIPDSGQQIPLHSASLALDASARPGLQARMTGYYTGPGNQQGLPGFIRTDFSLNKTLSHFGTVTAYVYNLFDYAAYYDNVNGYGIPLELNKYATASDYQPYFGAATQNKYGIGPRTVVLTYQVKI